MIIETGTDKYGNKATFRFNTDLEMEVWKAKGKPSRQITLKDHPLLNKKLRNKETKKIYNIERIYKEWHQGWAILFLVECNQSHKKVYWENINSHSLIVLKHIETDKKAFEII